MIKWSELYPHIAAAQDLANGNEKPAYVWFGAKGAWRSVEPPTGEQSVIMVEANNMGEGNG